MKKNIPNFITILNLISGVLGIHFLFNLNIRYAAYMVFLAALFDFLDGFAARMLKTSSPIGKSLDSLADIVSFGVLPGLLVFRMQENMLNDLAGINFLLPYTALIIPALSAVRLAIFNNDESQSYVFNGLPVPANALFFASLSIIYEKNETLIPADPKLLLVLTLLLSYLLVSNVKMFSLKFGNFTWRENILKYLYLAASLVLIIFLGFEGILFASVLYIIVSILKFY